MKIKFVNHACFIVEHAGVSIISDPWLEGRIFNNGWDLISKTKMSYEDFRNINYIWFSHEHPDHFYPPNLKKIPPEIRKGITVLFQNTIDGRVVNYCKHAGFKEVVELYKGKEYKLGEDFSVLCEYFAEGDSWIAYKAGGITILNTNDCGIRNKGQAMYIKDKVGKVDILTTQFSYAYWAGNREDQEFRKKIADEKLEMMKFQCDIFLPVVTIPIASFVYFCHEENFYLNDAVNTAEKTFNFLQQNTKTRPVVLHNGEEYLYPEEWDSMQSIALYKKDFERITRHPEGLAKNNPVELPELFAQASVFIEKLKSTAHILLRPALWPAKIFLSDYNQSYLLSLREDLKEIDIPYEDCDVALSSESLLFCLKNAYGLDTTQISGRMQKPKNGNYTRFYNLFRIEQQRSRGEAMGVRYLVAAGVRRIKSKLGLMKL